MMTCGTAKLPDDRTTAGLEDGGRETFEVPAVFFSRGQSETLRNTSHGAKRTAEHYPRASSNAQRRSRGLERVRFAVGQRALLSDLENGDQWRKTESPHGHCLLGLTSAYFPGALLGAPLEALRRREVVHAK
jgi:hypothetical protein